MGSTFAHSGKGYVGLILLERPDYYNFKSKKPYNYREYVQCKLQKPLLKDSFYLIRFMYAIAQFSTYTIGDPFAYVSREPIKAKNRNTLTIQYKTTADSTQLNKEQGKWCEVLSVIKAEGGEQYLTIGNFKDDASTLYYSLDYSNVPTTRLARIYEDGYAYYYIDDVIVEILPEKLRKLEH